MEPPAKRKQMCWEPILTLGLPSSWWLWTRSHFFYKSFKKKRRGKNVSAWKLAAYGPLWLTEFLSLNKTNFVKLTQHASFGREKLLTKQKSRCKKKNSSHWLSSLQSLPGKPKPQAWWCVPKTAVWVSTNDRLLKQSPFCKWNAALLYCLHSTTVQLKLKCISRACCS